MPRLFQAGSRYLDPFGGGRDVHAAKVGEFHCGRQVNWERPIFGYDDGTEGNSGA